MTSINKISKSLNSILSNLSDFHSLEVVNRVSETQLQLGDKSCKINLAVKGLYKQKNYFPCIHKDSILSRNVGTERLLCLALERQSLKFRILCLEGSVI